MHRHFVRLWSLVLPTKIFQAFDDISSVESCPEAGKTAMAHAAQQLPPKKNAANKPWISEATLNLIELRRAARTSDNYEEER